ncbi:MAG: hypothetical protein MW690_001660 [Methanophagales archaeon]|nr:DUF3344 domain-containing protein [Methanophagales archaeon]MCU4140184.1 hypothetical protein [Methanophagales archaeon]
MGKPYSIDFDLPHINAEDVEMARLYLYWLTWQKLETPSIDMEFNGKKIAYINDINDQNYFDDVQYVDIKGENTYLSTDMAFMFMMLQMK